jgi:hypothetical protein
MKNETIEDILIIGLAAAVSYFVIKDLLGGFGTNNSASLPSFSKIPTSGSSAYNPFSFAPSQILGPFSESSNSVSSSSGGNLGYSFNPFSSVSTPSQILGPSLSQIARSLGIGSGETS